jgi:hypothetical protein
LRAQLLMPVRKATGNFFRFGIKGGVSLTNLTLEGLTVDGVSDYVAQSMTAMHGLVGVFLFNRNYLPELNMLKLTCLMRRSD